MIVRDATPEDFSNAVALYDQFGGALPNIRGPEGEQQWQTILDHPGTSVLLVEDGDTMVAIVTLHILPNMTNEGRPYALIENVISDKRYRGQGAGRLVMQAAIDRAWDANAYKIMLLTGKNRGTDDATGFYESLGFSADEKQAFTLRRTPVRAKSTHLMKP